MSATSDDYEERIEKALTELRNNPEAKITQVASANRVGRGSLRDRRDGKTKSARKAHEKQQRLSGPQETALVEHILKRAHAGLPVRHGEIRRSAYSLLHNCNGEENPHLHGHWVTEFIKRHSKKIKTNRQRFVVGVEDTPTDSKPKEPELKKTREGTRNHPTKAQELSQKAVDVAKEAGASAESITMLERLGTMCKELEVLAEIRGNEVDALLAHRKQETDNDSHKAPAKTQRGRGTSSKKNSGNSLPALPQRARKRRRLDEAETEDNDLGVEMREIEEEE